MNKKLLGLFVAFLSVVVSSELPEVGDLHATCLSGIVERVRNTEKTFAKTNCVVCVKALFTTLSDEDKEKSNTLFLFDFDGVLAAQTQEVPRKPRSSELVRFYNNLRKKHSGRVFIYSAGTAFVNDSQDIGLSREITPEYLPRRLNENRNWIECKDVTPYEPETGRGFPPQRWHLPRSDNSAKGALCYYAGLGFFAHPHEVHHEDGSIKALHLPHILDITGQDVKNIIFIDDQLGFAAHMANRTYKLDSQVVIHFHE